MGIDKMGEDGPDKRDEGEEHLRQREIILPIH